ncbi:MAG: T9SS type A sorting domain-containing protein [Bacteroidales bacterium]|nr:T9SS type A sorting domain-containing protein [Bacteroidales bacterium]
MPFLVNAQVNAPIAVVYDTIDTCDSYTWDLDGHTYTTNSSGYYIYKNVSNQDSLMVLMTFVIRHSSQSEVWDSTCGNYRWALNGKVYTAPGNYNDTLVNASGCDSIITLHLLLKNPDTVYTDIAQCEPYTWTVDGNTYTSDTTVYVPNPTTSPDSCANMLALRYQRITYADTIFVSTCESSYTWEMDNNPYSGTGTATYRKENSGAGCDTIYVLSYATGIGQYQILDTTFTVLDSFVWVDDNEISHTIIADSFRIDTILTRTYPSLTNCDSISTYNVTILPVFRIDTAFCGRQKGGYRWPSTAANQMKIWLKVSGDTTYMCKDSQQKDSCLMYFNFTDLSIDTTWLPAVEMCDQYYWDANETTYRNSHDSLVCNLTSVNGCDSVVVLTKLTINALPNIYIGGYLQVRPGNSTKLFAVGDSNLTYLWSTGETTDTITVTPSENTEYSITATNSKGCQRSSTATVVVSEGLNQTAQNTVKVFPNPASTKVTIEGDNLVNVKLYNMLGQLIIAKDATSGKVVLSVNDYNNGSYILRAETADGKTTIRSVVIKK